MGSAATRARIPDRDRGGCRALSPVAAAALSRVSVPDDGFDGRDAAPPVLPFICAPLDTGWRRPGHLVRLGRPLLRRPDAWRQPVRCTNGVYPSRKQTGADPGPAIA